MTALHFDHIGLVVPDLAQGRDLLGRMLPLTHWTAPLEDPGLGVAVQFALDRSGLVYELIAPLRAHSPVSGALASSRNQLNHVAYRTDDLRAAADALVATGCHATGAPQPALAFGGAPVQFFVSPLRFIMELIEAPAHQHLWLPPEPGADLCRTGLARP